MTSSRVALKRDQQVAGQLPDEAHGIGEQHAGVAGEHQLAGGGVEGGEELILGQGIGTGERVEQRGLAGIGVADDGDGLHGLSGAPAAMGASLRAAAARSRWSSWTDPVLNAAAVGLELGLAGSAGTDAGAEAGERPLGADEPRQGIAELCQFYLQAAVAGAGVLREDIEDYCRAVEDLQAGSVLQAALLVGGQLVVGHDQGGVELLAAGAELGELAALEVGEGVRGAQALCDAGDGEAAGGVEQLRELVECVIGLPVGLGSAGMDGDQHGALGRLGAGSVESRSGESRVRSLSGTQASCHQCRQVRGCDQGDVGWGADPDRDTPDPNKPDPDPEPTTNLILKHPLRWVPDGRDPTLKGHDDGRWCCFHRRLWHPAGVRWRAAVEWQGPGGCGRGTATVVPGWWQDAAPPVSGYPSGRGYGCEGAGSRRRVLVAVGCAARSGCFFVAAALVGRGDAVGLGSFLDFYSFRGVGGSGAGCLAVWRGAVVGRWVGVGWRAAMRAMRTDRAHGRGIVFVPSLVQVQGLRRRRGR